MRPRPIARIAAVLAVLALGGCDDPQSTLKVGSKDFTESVILAEMVAALAEGEGIAVTRRLRLGDTLVALEALKSGEIDVYPEYNGTGLVMLGQPALADGDAAMRRVREIYEPLGLSWGERLGFANNYALAMRETRVQEQGIATISDLAGQAGDLTIGIDRNFQSRPLDGFQPLTSRYGMSFGSVTVVAPEDRKDLYDRVLSGEADVIMVFTTDPQIEDLGLVVLEDDLDFFPVYEAAPLVSAAAYARFPALRETLGRLAGRLDEARMRDLVGQSDIHAVAPRTVARAALAEMGLLSGEASFEIAEPLVAAVSPFGEDGPESGQALAALREAFPGRRVLLEAHADPLASVGSGTARVALAATVDFVDVGDGGTTIRPFEAVGVVGLSHLHLIAPPGGAARLSEVARLATGPEGSASHRAGAILAEGLDDLEIVPGAVDRIAGLLSSNEADAALAVAPLGAPGVIALLDGNRLIEIDGWNTGSNLVRYPQMREARIPAGTYDGQTEAVESLSSQLVIAGPVVERADLTGPAGPGASVPTPVSAVSAETAQAISGALGEEIGFDPAIPRAAALSPALPEPDAPVNPSAAISALSMAVFALFAWLIWLYARPERR